MHVESHFISEQQAGIGIIYWLFKAALCQQIIFVLARYLITKTHKLRLLNAYANLLRTTNVFQLENRKH